MRRSQDLEGPDMLIRHRRGWEIAEAQVTPETVFLDRRRLLKSAAAGSLLLGGAGLLAACDDMPAAQAQEGADPSARSEERRVGEGCVMTREFRVAPDQ